MPSKRPPLNAPWVCSLTRPPDKSGAPLDFRAAISSGWGRSPYERWQSAPPTWACSWGGAEIRPRFTGGLLSVWWYGNLESLDAGLRMGAGLVLNAAGEAEYYNNLASGVGERPRDRWGFRTYAEGVRRYKLFLRSQPQQQRGRFY